MYMEGKSDYKPMAGMENRMHVIGEGSQPVYICKKKDVPKLFNTNFFNILEVWQYFSYGFGLPNGLPWGEQDPTLMKCLLLMEDHYRRNFSQLNMIIELLKQR